MSDFFLGEIRLFSFNWAPQGWALCQGQDMPINQNQALYALLGLQYGGNGTTVFKLPDLRGRVIVGQGQNPHTGTTYQIGQAAGAEAVTLTQSQIPAHIHGINASADNATTNVAAGNYLATNPAIPAYATPGSMVGLQPTTIGSAGGGQAHPNVQPSLVLNYCIATQGIFPPRY